MAQDKFTQLRTEVRLATALLRGTNSEIFILVAKLMDRMLTVILQGELCCEADQNTIDRLRTHTEL